MSAYWKKLGQLFAPPENGAHAKLLTHAANPLAVHVEGDIYRIFYSGRDAHNKSSVGAVDINIVNRTIVNQFRDPFFVHGKAGSYFADGVSIGNCYTVGGQRYMLFMGWQNPTDGHWRGDVGRLAVTSDLRLELAESVPLLRSDAQDPYSFSYPWVLPKSGGGFDMWYGSTVVWEAGNGEMLHVLKHAESADGHSWRRRTESLPYILGQAQAFSRPAVLRNLDGYLDMWFSYRGAGGSNYRIGYARSEDGRNWNLDLQNAGIDVSQTGWDSEMIEYPYVFYHAGNRFMLYNGNGYGKTGFGLAIWTGDLG